MDPRTLPPGLAAVAREYAVGDRTPAEPRNASTVVLVRGGDGNPGGLEVYFLRRHLGMEFAAGMNVFPGGGVDARDAELDAALWAGPSPEEWAGRLGCTPAEAVALVCAAVRETFEESGVLLAGTATSVVADTTGESWEADRVALETRALSLTDFLTRRGLVLRTDLLAPLGGWLTPVFEPRRYRTWFFVAALPDGQVTRDVSTESDRVQWMTVRAALVAAERGDLLMLPPTVASCAEIFEATTPAEALAIAAAVPWAMNEPTFDLDAETLVVPERFHELARTVAARLREAGPGGVAPEERP